MTELRVSAGSVDDVSAVLTSVVNICPALLMVVAEFVDKLVDVKALVDCSVEKVLDNVICSVLLVVTIDEVLVCTPLLVVAGSRAREVSWLTVAAEVVPMSLEVATACEELPFTVE